MHIGEEGRTPEERHSCTLVWPGHPAPHGLHVTMMYPWPLICTSSSEVEEGGVSFPPYLPQTSWHVPKKERKRRGGGPGSK